MAVKTNSFGVSRAIEFFNKSNIFIGLGKPTAWETKDYGQDESVPADMEMVPPMTRETTTLTSVLGYKKLEHTYLVVPHDGSDVAEDEIVIDFATSVQWKVVPPNKAFAEGARYVYVEITVQPEDFPEGTYRQVGLFSELTTVSGTAVGKTVLTPAEVKNAGILEIIDNRRPAGLNEYSKETIKFVIKF